VLFGGVLALVGAVIAATGLYSVSAHWVHEAARDIGIRRAVGASDRHIAWWLGARLAGMVVPGAAGGVVLMAAAFQIVLAAIEQIGSPGIAQVTGVGAGVAIALLIATVVPFRRALSMDARELTRAS
jgi:putative ABC transport system permease protein